MCILFHIKKEKEKEEGEYIKVWNLNRLKVFYSDQMILRSWDEVEYVGLIDGNGGDD